MRSDDAFFLFGECTTSEISSFDISEPKLSRKRKFVRFLDHGDDAPYHPQTVDVHCRQALFRSHWFSHQYYQDSLCVHSNQESLLLKSAKVEKTSARSWRLTKFYGVINILTDRKNLLVMKYVKHQLGDFDTKWSSTCSWDVRVRGSTLHIEHPISEYYRYLLPKHAHLSLYICRLIARTRWPDNLRWWWYAPERYC